jgi:hypothetical protein
MKNIQDQLRLIREGAITESVSDDVVDQSMLEAVFEIFQLETAIIPLQESSAANLSLAALLTEAANIDAGTNPSEAQGFFAKVKAKIKAIITAFDPYEGIKELKLVNQIKVDRKKMQKSANWFGIIGIIVSAYKRAARYKEMKPDLVRQYLNEAENFKRKLQTEFGTVQDGIDKKRARKIHKMMTNLDECISDFNFILRGSHLK